MAKSFPKKKDFKGGSKKTAWKDRNSKSDEVVLPSVLFAWKQPLPGDVSPWFTLLPEPGSFESYVDLFLDEGMSWVKVGSTASNIYVNDQNDEYISALRIMSRGEASAVNNLSQWSRLWGVIDTWAVEHISRWHTSHIEHMRHHALEADTILKRMGSTVDYTCAQIFSMQSKEFPHQPLFFKQAITASLIAVMRRCHQLAIQNNAPLPPETLTTELDLGIRMGALLYIRKLYQDSIKVGSFIDPYHAMVYVILHSIATQTPNGWALSPPIDFLTYEKRFKPFDSPLVHTLGRQTNFSQQTPTALLKSLPSLEDSFTFAKVPAMYSKYDFELLYDQVWQKPGMFLIVAPEDITFGIRHLGPTKKWRSTHGINMIAMLNYSSVSSSLTQPSADVPINAFNEDIDVTESDAMPVFSDNFGDESPPDF